MKLNYHSRSHMFSCSGPHIHSCAPDYTLTEKRSLSARLAALFSVAARVVKLVLRQPLGEQRGPVPETHVALPRATPIRHKRGHVCPTGGGKAPPIQAASTAITASSPQAYPSMETLLFCARNTSLCATFPDCFSPTLRTLGPCQLCIFSMCSLCEPAQSTR